MPLYPLRCQDCGLEDERYAPIQQGKSSTSCPCGSVLRRVWTPPAVHLYQPHYNYSVGRYVSSDKEFRDALKQGSEDMSRQMGMDVNYEKVDLGDTQPKSGGVGLEEQARKHRELGWTEAKKVTFS